MTRRPIQYAELMTPGEVALAFKVDRATVNRWGAQGRLDSILTPSGQRRYSADQVRELLAASTTPRRETS
jgi:predicted site-specific integrase-resolvase